MPHDHEVYEAIVSDWCAMSTCTLHSTVMTNPRVSQTRCAPTNHLDTEIIGMVMATEMVMAKITFKYDAVLG